MVRILTKMKIKMKNILYLFLIAISISSCKVDNFNPPSVTLSGKVIDNVTNDMIENGGVNSGTIIQLFENNSTQPILSNSFPDGHFVNAAVFTGNYKLVAVGAFKMAGDTIRTTISKNMEVDIKVLPNLRLKATLQNLNWTTATVKGEYSKVFLNELAIVWSAIDNPNIYSNSEGGKIINNVTSQGLTTGEVVFTITGLTAGTRYYIRAAGRTNNLGKYYNYSTTIKTQ